MKTLKYFSIIIWGLIIGFIFAYVLFYTYYYYVSPGNRFNFFPNTKTSNSAIFIRPNPVPISATTHNNSPKPAIETTTKINVPVLMYHYVDTVRNQNDNTEIKLTVTPENFESQMKLLKDRGYTTISLSTITDSIKNNTSIPKKSIAITFDDGYSGVYTHAYPSMKKYDFAGTVFIIARKVDARGGYLSTGQIIELQDAGFELGSHTLTHHNLLSLSPSQALLEILKSKEELQRLFNTTIYFFCYPVGLFNNQVVQSVDDSGYTGAVTTQGGFVQKTSDLFRLPRVRISGLDTIDSFKKKLNIY